MILLIDKRHPPTQSIIAFTGNASFLGKGSTERCAPRHKEKGKNKRKEKRKRKEKQEKKEEKEKRQRHELNHLATGERPLGHGGK